MMIIARLTKDGQRTRLQFGCTEGAQDVLARATKLGYTLHRLYHTSRPIIRPDAEEARAMAIIHEVYPQQSTH